MQFISFAKDEQGQTRFAKEPELSRSGLASGNPMQNKVESLDGKARTCPTSSQSQARYQGP